MREIDFCTEEAWILKPGIIAAIRKLTIILEYVTDRIIFCVYILFFLMGLYGVYDNYLIYQNAGNDSILKYKPGYEAGQETEKKIQGNMAAWLTLDDTNIDYPVMQGKNNTEYLNKDPFGEYSLSGSIFLDSRNHSSFTDAYSLIYGHHMEGGFMFGALDEYMDRKYFYSHDSGTLMVKDMEYEIKIFAVLECDAEQEEVFTPVNSEHVLKYAQKNSLYFDKSKHPENAKRIIGLSTCKAPNTSQRIVVLGMLSALEDNSVLEVGDVQKT